MMATSSASKPMRRAAGTERRFVFEVTAPLRLRAGRSKEMTPAL
jgi:hypothetical protein